MFCDKRLGHKSIRLGHISIERLERLIKDLILLNLDFTMVLVCVWIVLRKINKQTNKQKTKDTKKCATRSGGGLLEVVHTCICESFDFPSFGREKYLSSSSMTFKIYLFNEKSQAMDALKVYIVEIERQLDRKVQDIRSGKSTEYY
jgi:hypothetical protein